MENRKMNSINIHGVVNIATEIDKLKTSKSFVRKLIIEDNKGNEFRICLFSDERSSLII